MPETTDQADLAGALQKMLQQMAAQHQTAVMPAQQMAPQVQQWPGMMPASAMVAPQPTGVLLGISIQLPDGREVPGYLQFDAQHAQNLPMLAQQVAAAYGPMIKAYAPRGYGGGYGGNYYGRRRY